MLSFCITSDDPLITLRYAYNFAHGHGPVFNVGERVEGFTSPLHLVVMTVLQWLPWGHVLLKAKLASLLFGLLSVRKAGQLYQQFELPKWALGLALVAGGSSFMMVLAASNGLETSLMCWLVTAYVVRLVRDRMGEQWIKTGVYAMGVVLVRPEGVVIVALGTVAALLTAGKGFRIKAIRYVVLPVVAMIVLLLARHAYYGYWLPNTFYAKNPPSMRALYLGVIYLGHVFQERASFLPWVPRSIGVMSWIFMVLQIALFVTGLFWQRNRKFLIISIVIVAEILIILKGGGDWMKGARFAAPVAPEVVLIEVMGALALFRKLRYDVLNISLFDQILPASVAVFLVVACCAPLLADRQPVWFTNGNFGTQKLVSVGGYSSGSYWWANASSLFRCAKPGDTIAWSEVGYFGLAELDKNVIDTRGLTDAYFAHNSPQKHSHLFGEVNPDGANPNSVMGRYMIAKKPAYILSYEFQPQSQLYNGLYRLVRTMHPDWYGRPTQLYVRSDRSC
jgi:hypothetical protein